MKRTSRISAIAAVLLVGAHVVSGCDDDGEPTGPNGGAPAQLAFIVQATDVAAGGAITPAPQVAVQDAAGNVVTSATDPVTIALGANPGGGTLMGTATFSLGPAWADDLAFSRRRGRSSTPGHRHSV